MYNKTYFFDTYALVEIFKGNKNYNAYAKVNVITSYLHLYELYYNLLKEYDEEKITPFFNRIRGFCVNLEFSWIIEASKFRNSHKNRNLSYADCLGYVISKNKKIKFLTGDKEFKDLDNVEFVK